jgi:hypothetical protein
MGMVTGCLALFLTLGGVGYAKNVIKLLNGSQIKKGSIPGDRLKSGSVTGKQINLSTLGTVPKSAFASSAGNANTATTAGNANTATTAGSANTATTAGHANSADMATTATELGSVTLVRVDGPTLATGGSESMDAFCPAGKQPIAGGGRTDQSVTKGTAITSSRPVVPGNEFLPGTGETLQGWRVTVNNESGTSINPSVFVVCAG